MITTFDSVERENLQLAFIYYKHIKPVLELYQIKGVRLHLPINLYGWGVLMRGDQMMFFWRTQMSSNTHEYMLYMMLQQ